jgi:hypothetical protein
MSWLLWSFEADLHVRRCRCLRGDVAWAGCVGSGMSANKRKVRRIFTEEDESDELLLARGVCGGCRGSKGARAGQVVLTVQ